MVQKNQNEDHIPTEDDEEITDDINILIEQHLVTDRTEWTAKKLHIMKHFPNAPIYNRLPERFRHQDRLDDFAKMLIKMEAVCVAIEEGQIDIDELVARYNIVTGI